MPRLPGRKLRLLLLVAFLPAGQTSDFFTCTIGHRCDDLGPLVPPGGVALTSTGLLRVQRSCAYAFHGGSQDLEAIRLSREDAQSPGLAQFNLSADGLSLTFGFPGYMDMVNPYDSYDLCWCQPNAATGEDCSSGSNFTQWMGTLQVQGVQKTAYQHCYRGQACSINIVASVSLQVGDRLAPLQRCATQGSLSSNPEDFLPDLPGMQVLEAQDTRTMTFISSTGVPSGDPVEAEAGVYALCFCRPDAAVAGSCSRASDFYVHTGYISILGPHESQEFSCFLGEECELDGFAGLQLDGSDRLTVRRSCSDASSGALLSSAYVSPEGSSSGTRYHLGTWELDTAPGSYELCWCGGGASHGFSCNSAGDFRAMGGVLALTCPAGYFNNGTKCQLCDVGNYCSGNPNWPRVTCPSGSTTRRPMLGARDVSSCVCSPGTYAAAGVGTAELVCQSCRPGMFAYGYNESFCRDGLQSCVLGQSCQNLGPMRGAIIGAASGSLKVLKRCGVEKEAGRVALSSSSPTGNASTKWDADAGGYLIGFGVSPVDALPMNAYSLCWCPGDGDCDSDEDFRMELGQLVVEGPIFGEWFCTLGRECTFPDANVVGVNLRSGDRLFVDYHCGAENSAIYGMPGTGIAERNDSGTFLFPPSSSNVDFLYAEPGIYKVCFCRRDGPDDLACNTSADFKAQVGIITAEGPQQVSTPYLCTLGEHCEVSGLRGVNLQRDDRVMLMKTCGEDSCNKYGVCFFSLASDTPSVYDLGVVSSSIPPGDWKLCWCSGSGDCSSYTDFKITAGHISFACSNNDYIDSTGSCVTCCTDCFLVRYYISGSGTSKVCNLSMTHIGFFVIAVFLIPSLVLALSFFAGPFVPLKDIEWDEADEASIITTAVPHHVLGWATAVPVVFRGTSVPWLDSGKEQYFVTVKDGNELRLLDAEGEPVTKPCDTSMGELRIPRLRAAIYCGKLYVPFSVYAVVVLAALVGASSVGDLAADEFAAITAFGIVVDTMLQYLRRRRGLMTEMVRTCQAYRSRLLVKNPKPQAGPRGAMRALKAEQLLDLYDYFQAFIRKRNMYYICPNIVLPLTKNERLAFADLAGPSVVDWFVSHYWGMPFKHFVGSIDKHAKSVAGADWKKVSYWVCTFSNNQWKVADEVGNGDWHESSFFKALRSGVCKGTAMVLDDQALPLTRSWCLFEVLQTRLLEEDDPKFAGLLLCTSSGVLNYGTASMDAATALAQRLSTLRLQDAQASCLEDKQMIESLVESMSGGFETMNDFVRDSIRSCLMTMKGRFDGDLAKLVGVLEESTERLERRASVDKSGSKSPHTPHTPRGPGDQGGQQCNRDALVSPQSTSATSAANHPGQTSIDIDVENDRMHEISLPGAAP